MTVQTFRLSCDLEFCAISMAHAHEEEDRPLIDLAESGQPLPTQVLRVPEGSVCETSKGYQKS